jgi:hypothetical protein
MNCEGKHAFNERRSANLLRTGARHLHDGISASCVVTLATMRLLHCHCSLCAILQSITHNNAMLQRAASDEAIIIIINPCKPYHFGIGTAPHPLGRWRVD